MQAAFYRGKGKIEWGECVRPTTPEKGILIKVQSCCLCGSDIRTFYNGSGRLKNDIIIGHEVSGEVVEVGTQHTKFKVGDRVSLGADIPCGHCYYCQKDMPEHCESDFAVGHEIPGGFAEYLALDDYVLEAGPVCRYEEGTSFDYAALAEPLACCLNGMKAVQMKKGKSVAIFGAGPIGNMMSLLAEIEGASEIFVIDPSDERLSKIVPKSHLINPTQVDVVETIKEKTKGRGVDAVLTACPVADTHRQAVEIVGKFGVVNFFGGLPKPAPEIPINTNRIHYEEIVLTGSHGSTPAQHKEALEMITSGKIKVGHLISGHFPLKQIAEAFEAAVKKDNLKIVIHPGS